MTFLEKEWYTIVSEGKLIAGNVINKAAAGPFPKPNARNEAIIGISAAVGMTNSIPNKENINMARTPLLIVVGNIHPCMTLRTNTVII